MRRERGLLCRGIHEPGCLFTTVVHPVKSNDQSALRPPAVAERGGVFHDMRAVLNKELLRTGNEFWRGRSAGGKPVIQPVQVKQSGAFLAALSIESTDCGG